MLPLVIDVRVSSAGGLVCVNVTIQNDEVVNRATYISLSLQADTDRVSTGHSVELIAMDNDGENFYFCFSILRHPLLQSFMWSSLTPHMR